MNNYPHILSRRCFSFFVVIDRVCFEGLLRLLRAAPGTVAEHLPRNHENKTFLIGFINTDQN